MQISRIGTDEWGAESSARRDSRRDPWGALVEWTERLPPWVLALAPLILGAPLALLGDDYILRVAAMACVLATLAAGLSLVVGMTGMLDLGYVALFGLGGYTYALLASPQLGLHTPGWIALGAALGAAALAGLLIGAPALRLSDDYLAVVTLGFGQVLLLLALKLDRVELPWIEGRLNLTGGPNGILGVTPPQLFGWAPAGQRDWLLLLLGALGLTLLLVSRFGQAPVGRAWRALREDPLAAATMGLPVRRLRLLAVTLGAAVAGLTGALFAGWQGAIFPSNLDLGLLLTIYAAIILGGLGNLPGALVGAAFMAALPELLRDPAAGRVLVYGAAALALLARSPRRWGLALLGALALGAGAAQGIPAGFDRALPGGLALLALAALLPALLPSAAGGRWRNAARVAALALLGFSWEARLVAEPALARPLLLGALLIGLMILRPHGLFGRPRVEVV